MNKPRPDHQRFLPVYPVIFLAGFTFLLYEVSWNRLLSLVLGTTVTASTIVLASFMAGFGVGAYVIGNYASKRNRLVRLLAFLLAGIGLLGGLDYFLFAQVIPHAYSFLPRVEFSTGLTELPVFGLVALLLFVQAFLMGGIFPVVNKIAVAAEDSIAVTLGRLYALETLGSALGGLAAGFLLLGLLGQRNTVMLAAIINLALAGWLFLASRFNRVADNEVSSPHAPPDQQGEIDNIRTTAGLRRTALVGALICGFAILSLQVVWMRMLRIYLTNTSYTFALVSSLAILGLFVGSAHFKRRGRRIGDLRLSLFRAMILMGASSALGLLLLVYLPETLMFPFQTVLSDPLVRALLLPFVAALLVVLPPAVFSGFAFPLTCRMYTMGRQSISRDVGTVLMVNTIGSVVGPVAAAFVLLPVLGASISIVLIIAALTGGALYISLRSAPTGSIRLTRTVLYIVIALLIATVIYRPQIRILPPSFSRFDREVLFYRESVEGTLSVGQDRGTRNETKYTFVNNSAVIGSTYDAVKVVKMVGHFPFLVQPEIRDVLVIGFGIGVTTSAIASHPVVESIECVELVAGLKDAAVYYRDLNQNVVEDPRLRITSGDGRHYLQRTSKKYDLISCDPTHPILGSGNLYTREYFALCREHLNPGGVVSQYLPLHKLRTEELLGLIGTFHAEFPNCTVWLGHFHGVLLGSMDPIHIDFETWSERVAALGQDEYFYSDPHHLAATLVLDGSMMAELASGSKINTDDRSYTEFFDPACLDADNISKNLRFFIDNRTDLGAVFEGIPDPEILARFVEGNRLLTESLYYKLSGDQKRSLEMLQQACRVNPEDQEFPFLIRLYY